MKKPEKTKINTGIRMNKIIYYIIKILLSSVILVFISEISKKSKLIGGIFASLPLVSLLAIFWIYFESGDTHLISSLSKSIFWLVIPSLSFFLFFPFLLDKNINFYIALFSSLGLMVILYYLEIFILKKFGIILQ